MSNYLTEQNYRVSNTLQGDCSIIRILLSGITPSYITANGEPDIRRISEEAAIRLARMNAGGTELEVKKSAVIVNGSVTPAVQFKAFVKNVSADIKNYYISISEQLAIMFCQPNLGRAQLTFNHELYTQHVTWR